MALFSGLSRRVVVGDGVALLFYSYYDVWKSWAERFGDVEWVGRCGSVRAVKIKGIDRARIGNPKHKSCI